jgi:hypothetical protein
LKRIYTTCRDLALKLQDAGVPVEHRREGRVLQFWYPAWAGRAQQLIKAAGIPAPSRRAVLAALAHDADRRAALEALDAAGAADRVRLFLLSLA